jgi:hypothetical protein
MVRKLPVLMATWSGEMPVSRSDELMWLKFSPTNVTNENLKFYTRHL